MDKSRIFKIVLGVVIISAGLLTESEWWTIGIIPLFMGVVNRCPSFLPGQSSCKTDLPEKDTKKLYTDLK